MKFTRSTVKQNLLKGFSLGRQIFVLFFIIMPLFLMPTTIMADNLYNWPESAVYDAVNKRYLISNTADGNIIQVGENGETSIFNDELSSVRGLQIVGNIVYAASDSGVVGFNLATAQRVSTVVIPDAQFLNDITADPAGNLYVTDSNAGRIYKVVPAAVSWSLLVDSGILGPNGIFYDSTNTRLLINGAGGLNTLIQAISMNGMSITNIATTNLQWPDGLTEDNDGNFFISFWKDNSTYMYAPDFSNDPMLVTMNHTGPADILYNKDLDVLVVPNFDANTVDFFDMNCPRGDLNCDGVVSAQDLTIFDHFLGGNIQPGAGSPLPTTVPGDVDGDYEVSAQDFLTIKTRIANN